MKLSEAIRLNGMMKPQGRGSSSMHSSNAPCALGGALQSIGRQKSSGATEDNYDILWNAWPWVRTDIPCPICKLGGPAYASIYCLNDVHKRTREQIAAWVATVEPSEPEAQGEQTDVEAFERAQ
jgi:hypothetical protein